MHGDALSVADWIRLSRLGDVRSPRRCTAKLVRVAALLSLSGGWLAVRTAESSRLLSLSSGKEIEDAPPRTRTACPAPGFPRGVQAGSHRLAQVFHGVLLAPASSVGDDFPGRRRATARRLPERPCACCGHGEDGRVSPRSRTALAGSPRHDALQCAAKRSTRFSGRRSRRMVSNDEHEMRARPAGPGCVWTARAPISLRLLRAANPRASSLSFICPMGS